MNKLGYNVTLVETGAAMKKGGTPVDIRDDSIAMVERMGIFDAIRAKSLPPRVTEFVNITGGIDARIEAEDTHADGTVDGYEIHRDDLLEILFDATTDDVEVLFDNSIVTLTETSAGEHATFRDGTEGDFAIVLGCEGSHSALRKMRFGPETDYSHFLHNYFTVAVVDDTFIAPGITRILNTPGRTMMLNSYEDRTDIALVFHSDDEIPYDYHDAEQQKNILREQFTGAGTQFVEMIDKAEGADNFYFDKLSQIRMPKWSSGRVVLVGDAAYCASPAAGMGGSLAIMGATYLFDAFQSTGGDIQAAFSEYERSFRPVVEEIQDDAVNFGVATFFPETDEAIHARNAFLTGS
jgi:2-polyprenyl-6-methoxyphenol hydroxylase-like FAD-dependent oxidoreductase